MVKHKLRHFKVETETPPPTDMNCGMPGCKEPSKPYVFRLWPSGDREVFEFCEKHLREI